MIRAAALCLLASPAFGQDIDVQFQDGNPFDRFIAFNRGCPIAAATLTVDFTTSRGGIVIDTVRGGPGTRDPMDARLTEGNATLVAVTDGDQGFVVDVIRFPTISAITVVMDVDDTTSLFEDGQVFADGQELSGTTVALTLNDETVSTQLDTTGRGRLTIPPSAGACPIS